MSDEQVGDSKLVLTIEVPDSVPDDELGEAIKRTALALDAFYRSLGGSGLKVASVKIEGKPEKRWLQRLGGLIKPKQPPQSWYNEDFSGLQGGKSDE